jgi:hypothetical protein
MTPSKPEGGGEGELFELTYSSGGDFYLIPFDPEDEVQCKAAAHWKRRVARIDKDTRNRWEAITQAYWNMQQERNQLFSNTAPFAIPEENPNA